MRNFLDATPKSLHDELYGKVDSMTLQPFSHCQTGIVNGWRTTNGVERLNEKIRRRDRVIRIYPNQDSVTRLIGALLMEMDEKWQTGHKYLDMAEYFAWCDEQKKQREEHLKLQQINLHNFTSSLQPALQPTILSHEFRCV